MDDLISRQDTIDAILAVTGNSSVRELYEHVQEHELSDMWSGGVNAAIDIIIAVPSAQPEQKKGRWIETNIKGLDYVYCSECQDTYYPVPIDVDWYYCPHCGAKMEDEQE